MRVWGCTGRRTCVRQQAASRTSDMEPSPLVLLPRQSAALPSQDSELACSRARAVRPGELPCFLRCQAFLCPSTKIPSFPRHLPPVCPPSFLPRSCLGDISRPTLCRCATYISTLYISRALLPAVLCPNCVLVGLPCLFAPAKLGSC